MQLDRLPWHTQQWQLVSHALKSDRLPHALLLHGPAGLGKAQFQAQLARLLICASPVAEDESVSLRPCGQCKPCIHGNAEAQADIFKLKPEEEGKAIKIAPTRESIDFCSLASHYGGRKLVLIQPAEALNLNAANALLKTLEEPTNNTVLILVSHQASKLLPTIRSRCLQIRFSKPSTDVSIKWLENQGLDNAKQLLEEAQAYPMKALQLGETQQLGWREQKDKELLLYLNENRSASGLARYWLEKDSVDDIHAWLYDRLRRTQWIKHGWNGPNSQNNPNLDRLAAMPQLDKLERLLDEVNAIKKSEIYNINKQLVVESVLISMTDDAVG